MLPLKNRLKKDKDFKEVFKRGKKLGLSFFVLSYAKTNLNESRFGFVVSNKVSKKAVVRQKIKRRLREVIRLLLDKIKPGYDVVIISAPEIKDKTYEEISEGLRKALRKTKILA